jgi:hypothetical protein
MASSLCCGVRAEQSTIDDAELTERVISFVIAFVIAVDERNRCGSDADGNDAVLEAADARDRDVEDERCVT